MAITAKELAKRLNLSPTAVSMALNNKPGVSRETRQLVIEEAEKCGYDFSRLSTKRSKQGSVYFIHYRSSNAIVSYVPIFDELLEGMEQECQRRGYQARVIPFYEKTGDLGRLLEDLRVSDCIALILLGTEMKQEAAQQFSELSVPLVILDSYFETLNSSYVLINNRQGAYLAADYLISRCEKLPGYLRSSVPLQNFAARREGFEDAVREHGMSVSRCVSHTLSPSIEGAMADMLEVLERGDALAECYFAENDLIAIGAMKALKLRGYHIPEDIAVIGFDNISESRVMEPSLTTVSVPRRYMGRLAAQRALDVVENPVPHTVKIEVAARLVKRQSV